MYVQIYVARYTSMHDENAPGIFNGGGIKLAIGGDGECFNQWPYGPM